MLYWDAERQLSIAMVTNNSLAPAMQQRLQRAIVAYGSRSPRTAAAELDRPLAHVQANPGLYRTSTGEMVAVTRGTGPILRLTRQGVTYDVYPMGNGIGYSPGLDVYITGSRRGALHILSLYEDQLAELADRQ